MWPVRRSWHAPAGPVHLEPRSSPPPPSALEQVSREVLDLVVALLQREYSETLSSLALTSTRFYHLARYHQLHDLTLHLNSRDTPLLSGTEAYLGSWAAYLAKTGLAGAVRRLTVCGSPGLELELPAVLSSFIASLTGLLELTWHHNAPIPEAILNDLQRRPSLRLHVRLEDLHPAPSTCPVLGNLIGCGNLIALELEVEYTSSKSCCILMRPLRRLLLSCPNLQRLKLDIHTPKGGCVLYNFQDYHGIGFRDGERPLAALEELELQDYPFGGPLLSGDIQKGYDLPIPEDEYWIDNFDWSRLKNLKVHPPYQNYFVKPLIPYLVSLRELDLPKARSRQTLLPIFARIPPNLEAIHIETLASIRLGTLQKHGASLRRLTLHQSQSDDIVIDHPRERGRTWAEGAIDLQGLKALRKYCPSLEYLAIDLIRAGAWPYAAFDILASFPCLRKLDIWFELGTAAKQVHPPVTFHAVRDIYQYLSAKSATKAPRLEQVTIHSCPSVDCSPRHYPDWAIENSTAFVCKLSQRDDAVTRNLFSTTFTSLGQLENQFLQQSERGWDDAELQQRISDFLVKYRTPDEPEHLMACNDYHRAKQITLAYSGPLDWLDEDEDDL